MGGCYCGRLAWVPPKSPSMPCSCPCHSSSLHPIYARDQVTALWRTPDSAIYKYHLGTGRQLRIWCSRPRLSKYQVLFQCLTFPRLRKMAAVRKLCRPERTVFFHVVITQQRQRRLAHQSTDTSTGGGVHNAHR